MAIIKEDKFVVEYRDENKKVTARWHYDYTKTTKGPVLVETLDYQEEVKKKTKQKNKKEL